MGTVVEHHHLSEEEYLATEEAAPMKREYVAGEVFAMAGGSERHNRIALNIAFHLRGATRGHACRAFMADMKLRVEQHATYYYPDAMLVCDEGDDHPLYKVSPCFIAEVLSPATAAIDQREKWLHYRDIPSLRYYLLVDSEKAYARLLLRQQGGAWQEQTLGAEDVARIECAGLSVALSLEDLYEDTGLL
jgi:Uma2 family endonuclease